MRTSKIITIEGITGIGKSYLGQHLDLTYRVAGIPARWYFELEPDNPVISLHHDRRVIEASVESWRTFLQRQNQMATTVIIDGRLFMITIVKALESGIAPDELIPRLLPLVQLAGVFGIFCVYLTTSDIEGLFARTSKTRSSDDWYITSCEESEYCIRKGLRGITAVVEFHREVDRILRELYGLLNCPKLALDVTNRDWEQGYRDVETFLDIPTDRRKQTPVEGIGDLVGSYAGAFRGAPAVVRVALENGQLRLVEHPNTAFKPVEQVWTLVAVERDVFVAKGQPVRFVFQRDHDGAVTGVGLSGMHSDPVGTEGSRYTDGFYRRVNA